MSIHTTSTIYDVVGMGEYPARRMLKRNAPLALAREPKNTHDPNAIRVSHAGGDQATIGYIQKNEARRLARLMDDSGKFNLISCSIDRIIDNWNAEIRVVTELPVGSMDVLTEDYHFNGGD